MLEILIRAASLILIIIIGYLMKKIGWVTKDDFRKFSKIVLKLTLPCAIITSFNEYSVYPSMILFIVIGILVNLISAALGFITGKPHGKVEQAFNILNYGSFNVGAFTIPFVSSFLGAEGVLICGLFDLGNAIGEAGFNYSLAKSLLNENRKIIILDILKVMFSSVIFDVYIIMFILRLLNLKLPSPIITFTGIVGQANIFLAMLMIGIAFEIHLNYSSFRKVLNTLVTRYALNILCSIFIFNFLPLPLSTKKILCITLFSPMATMALGLTEEVKGDVTTSAFLISVSTIISIVIITVLLAIFL